MQLKLLTIGIIFVSLYFSSDPGATVAPLESYTPRERSHWAYVKRGTPVVPTITAITDVTDQAWVKSPIDAFLLERMKREGLRPAPAAGSRPARS